MSGTQTSIITFSEDITNAKAPPPLPPRSYRGEVVSASVRPAPNGFNYLNLAFRIPAEEYPADYTEGDPDGTVVYYSRIRCSDDGTGRHQTSRAMKRLGGPTGQQLDCNALLGLWGNLDVGHYIDNEGDPRAQVTRLLDP